VSTQTMPFVISLHAFYIYPAKPAHIRHQITMKYQQNDNVYYVMVIIIVI